MVNPTKKIIGSELINYFAIISEKQILIIILLEKKEKKLRNPPARGPDRFAVTLKFHFPGNYEGAGIFFFFLK